MKGLYSNKTIIILPSCLLYYCYHSLHLIYEHIYIYTHTRTQTSIYTHNSIYCCYYYLKLLSHRFIKDKKNKSVVLLSLIPSPVFFLPLGRSKFLTLSFPSLRRTSLNISCKAGPLAINALNFVYLGMFLCFLCF